MTRIYEAWKRSEPADDGVLSALTEGNPVPEEGAGAEEEFAAGEPVKPHRPPVPPRVTRAAATALAYRTARIRLEAGAPVLPFDGTDARSSEQYRILRTNILHHPAKPAMIAITSPGPGDGKTLTAINVAGALALMDEMRTVLVDADLRRQGISPALGFDPVPGLAEVLRGECALEEAIVSVEQLPSLHVLPGGDVGHSNPAELLDSATWQNLAAELRAGFHVTLIDTTPIASVADFGLVQLVCDGTVVIVRPDHTNRFVCRDALRLVPKEKLLGIVVNCVEDWPLWKAPAGSHYYSAGRRR